MRLCGQELGRQLRSHLSNASMSSSTRELSFVESRSFVTATQSSRQSFWVPSAIIPSDDWWMPANAAVGCEHVWCHDSKSFCCLRSRHLGCSFITDSAFLRYRIPCTTTDSSSRFEETRGKCRSRWKQVPVCAVFNSLLENVNA